MVLSDLGIICALGDSPSKVWQAAVEGTRTGMRQSALKVNGAAAQIVGQVDDAALVPQRDLRAEMRTRNNQLAATAFKQIETHVQNLKSRYGAHRIAVIIGSSTSGIKEGEDALAYYAERKMLPKSFNYAMQEMHAPAAFIADLAGVTGPTYSISTACSSSARALMSARALLRSGLVDAVIVGGVDSLCRLTLNGFAALESTAEQYCQPFSRTRNGINIGEGAALFVAVREELNDDEVGVCLSGAGQSSDAYHMTAPEPNGRGAIDAIQAALRDAKITAEELGYINLHGTGTILNDAMESKAITAVGAELIPASSTKSMTGHTLGAAGAIEAALCWLTLRDQLGTRPLHVWDGKVDSELQPINLYHTRSSQLDSVKHCLSNSFAFGGNNVALVFSRVSK